jgi:hypothetical protein
MKNLKIRKNLILFIVRRLILISFINLVILFFILIMNLLLETNKPLSNGFKIWVISTLTMLLFGGIVLIYLNWKNINKNL